MTVDTHEYLIDRWRSEIARHDQAISEHQRDRDIAITMLEKEMGKPVPPEFLGTQSGNPVIGQMQCGCPLRFPISHRPGCPEYRPPAVYPGTLEYMLEAEKRMTEMLTGQSSRLSSRLRSGVECAPWVIEEVKVLEAQIESEKAGPAQEEYDQLDYECRQATYAYDRWKRYAKMLETELTAVKEDLNLLRAYREVLLDIAFGTSSGEPVRSVQSNPELNPSCMAYNVLGGRWDQGKRLDTRETITTLPKVVSAKPTVFGPGRINEKGQWEIPRIPTEEEVRESLQDAAKVRQQSEEVLDSVRYPTSDYMDQILREGER